MPLIQLSQFDFHHVLNETPSTSVVMFGSPECGACRRLKQAFDQLAQIAPELHLFEVDVQRDTALAREFEVFHLPSMFLFQNGRYHAPLHSHATPDALQRQIALALAQPAQEAP